MIIKAEISDHQILSAITKASKAYWGYSQEQMKEWDEELTIQPDYIKENIVYKLIENDEVIGYYSLEEHSNTLLKLENLFIHPDHIGRGFGEYLMEHAFLKAKELECEEMILESDPNASLFYEKLGFVTVGQKETSIKGRYMPIMKKKMKEDSE